MVAKSASAFPAWAMAINGPSYVWTSSRPESTAPWIALRPRQAVIAVSPKKASNILARSVKNALRPW